MKKLFLIICLLFNLSIYAQHTINLTNGNIIKGKITDINKKYVHIISEDSIHVYDAPYQQIVSYNAGAGEVQVNKVQVKETTSEHTPQNLSAGDELIKAANLYYAGVLVATGGVLISTIGASVYAKSSNPNPNTTLAIVYAGTAVTLVGAIINFTAFSHIANAGKKFNAISGKVGLGVSMNF